MFEIILSKQPERFIKKANPKLQQRILEKIDLLKTTPTPHTAVSIAGESKTFRVRVGEYRIIYKVFWGKNTILVKRIDKRPNAYK